MSKEDTRAELERDKRTIEEQIDEELNKDEVDFGKLGELNDKLDKINNELEELTTEMAQNSGTDFDNARDGEENRELSKQEEIAKETKRVKEENEKEELNKKAELESKEEVYDNREPEDEFKQTPEEWRKESGIRVLGLPEGEKYSRDEYLDNPNIVYVIEEPGKAEVFLGNNSEAWDSVKTSIPNLYNAISNNNFPIEVNSESYIILDREKGKVTPNDKNEGDKDNNKIDKEDIIEATDSENKEESKDEDGEKDNDNSENKEQRFSKKMLNKSTQFSKTLVKVMAVDALHEFSTVAPGALAKSLESAIPYGEAIGGKAIQTVGNALKNDLENPDPEKEEEIDDDDFGEFTPPPVV